MGQPDILCIGAVLWDVIGRAASVMRVGSDVPGRITRVPGGVAMNIAMALRRFDLRPALMTTVGQDAEGDELLRQADARGLITEYVCRSLDLPTDQYMAIEGANGLIAAIADAHSLESAGAKILAPLRGGALTGWTGPVALDGNLTLELLREIAKDLDFATMDLRIAPASPGKAERLLPFLGHGSATLYVNLEEAGLLCSTTFDTARAGAEALLARGAARVLVTDGGRPSALGSAEGVIEAAPPEVLVTRITGAGDTFMAGHIAAEMSGAAPAAALDAALARAAAHVSGEMPL